VQIPHPFCTGGSRRTSRFPIGFKAPIAMAAGKPFKGLGKALQGQQALQHDHHPGVAPSACMEAAEYVFSLSLYPGCVGRTHTIPQQLSLVPKILPWFQRETSPGGYAQPGACRERVAHGGARIPASRLGAHWSWVITAKSREATVCSEKLSEKPATRHRQLDLGSLDLQLVESDLIGFWLI